MTIIQNLVNLEQEVKEYKEKGGQPASMLDAYECQQQHGVITPAVLSKEGAQAIQDATGQEASVAIAFGLSHDENENKAGPVDNEPGPA